MSKEINKKGIIHIFSSFNNTIINVTDITGAETISSTSGGMVVRSGREKPGPFAAMQQVNKIADELKSKGIYDVDIRVKAPGVTPVAHGTMRRKSGKRGRRV